MIHQNTIEVRGLSTGYESGSDRVVVSECVTDSLRSGELTCLLGPNGAGKSTLLKTLSGFLKPMAGCVNIGGRPLESYSQSELARMIGVVLTDKPSLGNMTVRQLVAMGRSPYTGFWGRLSSVDSKVIDEAMRSVGIEEFSGRELSSLSDGERQKAMIAKALAQETPIIFLDEPTAFLDYPSKVEIMRLLHRLSRLRQKTIFLSTHDLELALQIADRLWLVDKRLGVSTGCPEDLALDGRLSSYFESGDVRFDDLTGLFAMEMPCSRAICVESDSTAVFNMLGKALARNGIRIDSKIQNTCKIEAYRGYYYFDGRCVRSIGELIDALETRKE